MLGNVLSAGVAVSRRPPALPCCQLALVRSGSSGRISSSDSLAILHSDFSAISWLLRLTAALPTRCFAFCFSSTATSDSCRRYSTTNSPPPSLPRTPVEITIASSQRSVCGHVKCQIRAVKVCLDSCQAKKLLHRRVKRRVDSKSAAVSRSPPFMARMLSAWMPRRP